MPFALRSRWTLGLVAALALAGLVTALPARPAGADGETFFTGSTCPIAHCNQQLDGREGIANGGSMLKIPVSTPPSTSAVAVYTPTPPIAVNTSLGCTVGQAAPHSVPDLVACDGGLVGSGTAGPFVYALTATGTTTPSLTLNWHSASYSPSQPLTCTPGLPFAMDHYVVDGAPLFSDTGNTYVSDDHAIAKYNPDGTCNWGKPNPDHAALISWNAIYLPPNGPSSNPYPGGFYLVGQGTAGPVVLANYYDASIVVTLPLTETTPISGYYVTYNTISAVQTATGARLYDSTGYCPTNGGCDAFAVAPGRLYAIDVTAPITAGGTPTMAVAWWYDFEGPSGASPMVLPAASGAPVGDQVYFDGSGAYCTVACPDPTPTLYALSDTCPFGCATNAYTPTLLFSKDFTALGENGKCGSVYRGMQAAPALEGPEVSGTDHHYSVWAFVTCGLTLYRFDAQTGAVWPGAGAITISVPSLPGLLHYIPSSTMETITNTTTGHDTMFIGAQQVPASFFSYVVALDLETGGMLWKVGGPSNVLDNTDTPFNGQFPIAATASGGYVLIATTAGAKDGSSILGIPLS